MPDDLRLSLLGDQGKVPVRYQWKIRFNTPSCFTTTSSNFEAFSFIYLTATNLPLLQYFKTNIGKENNWTGMMNGTTYHKVRHLYRAVQTYHT